MGFQNVDITNKKTRSFLPASKFKNTVFKLKAKELLKSVFEALLLHLGFPIFWNLRDHTFGAQVQ